VAGLAITGNDKAVAAQNKASGRMAFMEIPPRIRGADDSPFEFAPQAGSRRADGQRSTKELTVDLSSFN
jgi:hypothetical protein